MCIRDRFGDVGVHTLRSCAKSQALQIPNLRKAGLGNIQGLSFLGQEPNPTGAVARLAEASMGKDTTIGHWEIAVSYTHLDVYKRQAFKQQKMSDNFHASFLPAVGADPCVRPW